jgi:hypothetical protein
MGFTSQQATKGSDGKSAQLEGEACPCATGRIGFEEQH